jgi:SRSO17 transposase
LELKRTRWHVQEDEPSGISLAKLFAEQKNIHWHHCSWKSASDKTRQTRLAWIKVYLPGALDRGAASLEELWLVVDWPEADAEPYHYYLAHLHRPPHKARLLQLSRARWNIEQYFQRAKTDLGLDHFEGRSWRGFHHHLIMAVLAYLFVTVIYLRAKKNFWCDLGADSQTDPALGAALRRLL